ncbi:MAG: fumarate hydratase, partial [Actinomycetota bacterium]|nr:fumarate hydratase [Actinomycetota bacterium]
MGIRVISADKIKQAIIHAIGEIYCRPNPEVLDALIRARKHETEELPRDVLETIIQNAGIGSMEGIPICQDTGSLIVFARIGNKLIIEGEPLKEIIEAAASEAWQKYYLRYSIVQEPLFFREIHSHKIPCILHTEIVKGDQLFLHLDLKGGG